MVSFAPNLALALPGKGAAPRGVKNLRVRAFPSIAVPIPAELLAIADGYDQGCGGLDLARRDLTHRP